MTLNNTPGQRRFGRQSISGTGLRRASTFEENRDAAAAIQRWKDAQAHPLPERRAGSEPVNVEYDEPTEGEDDV